MKNHNLCLLTMQKVDYDIPTCIYRFIDDLFTINNKNILFDVVYNDNFLTSILRSLMYVLSKTY